MITRMRSLFGGPSTSTEGLWKQIALLDELNAEHLDKLGKYAPEADMVLNVWFGMTAEFAREAARADVEQEGCSYKKVKERIEQFTWAGASPSASSTRTLKWASPRRPRGPNQLNLLQLLPSRMILQHLSGQALMHHSAPFVAKAAEKE